MVRSSRQDPAFGWRGMVLGISVVAATTAALAGLGLALGAMMTLLVQ